MITKKNHEILVKLPNYTSFRAKTLEPGSEYRASRETWNQMLMHSRRQSLLSPLAGGAFVPNLWRLRGPGGSWDESDVDDVFKPFSTPSVQQRSTFLNKIERMLKQIMKSFAWGFTDPGVQEIR